MLDYELPLQTRKSHDSSNGRNSKKKLKPLSARGSTKNKKASKIDVINEVLAPENETRL